MDVDWVIVGGAVSGMMAGGAARYGRLCTMRAVEDALVAKDFRGLKAWGLALAAAIASTQAAVAFGAVDLTRNIYTGAHVHVLGAIAGGLMFGLGMTLVGTCSFGLTVRAGGGDMRAVVAAVVVGVFAMAFTAGVLAPLRVPLLAIGAIDFAGAKSSALDRVLALLIGDSLARLTAPLLVIGLAAVALMDAKLRRRPRLIAGALAIGLSVGVGWLCTSRAVSLLSADRVESLSFVAPVGRALLQFMMEPFRNYGFGVAALAGSLFASMLVAAWRGDLRWEAFDDPTEMKRHLVGAALMGLGGVLGLGCTIGQGLTAASALAISAPLFVLSVLAGAKIGLNHLIEGRSFWRAGNSRS